MWTMRKTVSELSPGEDQARTLPDVPGTGGPGESDGAYMNYGSFSKDTYTKRVDLWKAVLWHTRSLSLRKDIMDRIRVNGIKKIIFVDDLKGKRWTFPVKKVFAKMMLKQEGQEAQYYFPIDIAKKETFEVKPKQYYVLDADRGIYVEAGSYDPKTKTMKVVMPASEQTVLF